MATARASLRPLAAALLLAVGRAGAAGIIDVNIGGDVHVSGRCTLREAIVASNTHATPADTNCWSGSDGGNTIVIPPAIAPIEVTGAPLDITDAGGETTIRSAVSGTRVEVRRVSGTGTVFTASRPVAFEDLSISGGQADMVGGGISVSASTATLTRCRVSGNHSDYAGGGILVSDGGTLTVSDSTIAGNSTGELGIGGGIASDDASTVVLANTTVSGNSSSDGGGLFMWKGHLSLANSTVSGNTAIRAGGGIATYALDTLDLVHSTVAANSASAGAGIRLYSGPALATAVTAFDSLLAGNIGSPDIEHTGSVDDIMTGDHNLIGSVGENVTVPPDTLACDPGLLPLADNGGPTATHALAGDSCARDAGGTIARSEFDQRGEGHPRLAGEAVDIGAYELDAVDLDRLFANGFD
jgi:hypothetical protein